MTNDSTTLAWRTSTFSGSGGSCVEVAPLDDGGVAVRNTRDRDGGTLWLSRDQFAGLLAGARAGEFDDLA